MYYYSTSSMSSMKSGLISKGLQCLKLSKIFFSTSTCQIFLVHMNTKGQQNHNTRVQVGQVHTMHHVACLLTENHVYKIIPQLQHMYIFALLKCLLKPEGITN